MATGPTSSAVTARSMIDAMAMPMLGDSACRRTASSMWSAPGMVADRAQSWSVAQERSSADLSFDFVTPELVLAARVYGLGPAEAAQAARLAIAGPGQLSAMAGMVDRTFVQAMAADADRREAGMRAVSAYPQAPADARRGDGDICDGARRRRRGDVAVDHARAGSLDVDGAGGRCRAGVPRRDADDRDLVRRRAPHAAWRVPVAGGDDRCAPAQRRGARWSDVDVGRRARAARRASGRRDRDLRRVLRRAVAARLRW